MLGITIATEKVDGQASVVILFDTERMEAQLPRGKLQATIKEWLHKKKATKREVLSLVGHAMKVIHPGHTFVSRMYSTAAKVKELDCFRRLNKEFQSDLY